MTLKEAYEQAQKGGALKDLTPQFFQFKADGDVIMGVLVGRSEVESRKNTGKYTSYVVQNDEGSWYFACGSQFDTKTGSSLQEGHAYVWIYHGKRAVGGGRSVNQIDCREIPLPPGGIDLHGRQENPL